jgi:hypothetical protein
LNVTIETELMQALRERLAIIADDASRRDPPSHMERLRKVSERIEQLTEALPPSGNAQLAHYLARRSYDKALDFLARGERLA